jgi:hypothetical protein
VLIGKSKSVQTRIAAIVVSTFFITLLGIVLARFGAWLGMWDWPPQPSSGFGVLCGFIGGLIVLFEMAILPRKWFRGRPLGRTKVWLALHIWLGLVCLPIILVHSGFGFGGPLTSTTLTLFLLVIASGIWGLIMQQWIPQKILAEIPGETIATQVPSMSAFHVQEATQLIQGLIEIPSESNNLSSSNQQLLSFPATAIHTSPLVVGRGATELKSFLEKLLLPYLRDGRSSRSPLASRADVQRRIASFREILPIEAHPILVRIDQICDLRRQWDTLSRLNFWLHGWLCVHLPLSVCMTGLMILHAIRALKYW